MKTILISAVVSYCAIIGSGSANAADGTISVELPGQAVSFWGTNKNYAASSDPNGILLGSGYVCSDPCYCFLLPPVSSSHTISSITVEIIGTGTITSLAIGNFNFTPPFLNSWSWTYTGQGVTDFLENVSDYFGPSFINGSDGVPDTINGKLLWVKLFVNGGSWPSGGDQYDLKKIVVTYTYTNVSNAMLGDFQTMYQAAHGLHLYNQYVYSRLWVGIGPALINIGDTWRSAITSLCSIDPVSVGLSGVPLIQSLWDSTYGLSSSCDGLTSLASDLNFNAAGSNFWTSVYNGFPTNIVGAEFETAINKQYAYSQSLLSAFDTGVSSSLYQAAMDSNTALRASKSGFDQAVNNSGGLYDIYVGLRGDGTDQSKLADLIIQGLSPWLVYSYDKQTRPQITKSYFDDIVSEINREFSGSLTVTILPADAVTAGAMWQVDEGTWHKSGDPQSGLFAGMHTVNFNSVTGWLTPPGQAVEIDANSTQHIYVYMQFSPIGDFNGDGNVDFLDLCKFAQFWLANCSEPAWCDGTDIDKNGSVNFTDFSKFAANWFYKTHGDMVPIYGGTFQMGDSKGDGHAEELPVHTVTLNSFYIDKYDITNQQYCDFLNSAAVKVASGVVYASTDSGNNYPYCDTYSSSAYSQIAYGGGVFCVRTKGGRSMSNDPMVMVSWYGSVAYCNWRSQQEGKGLCYNLSTWVCDFTQNGYHLPTEAQWEYSARGGLSGNRFPWGDTITHSQANYDSYSGYSYDLGGPPWGYDPTWSADGIMPFTSPVGSFAANGYGLYDMGANVWQWCNDWYVSYSSSPQTNPTGPATGSDRVVCGGGWAGGPGCGRVALRGGNYPYLWHHDTGFRVSLGLN